MRIAFALICASTFGLFASHGAEAKDIRKQKQFLEAVAGKKLVSGNSWLIVTPDGKIEGVGSKGQKIVGAWVWNKRFYCRNVVVGDRKLPEDCQKVSIEGDQVTFTREKGKGEPVVMTVTN